MRLLFSIDKKDYDPNGVVFSRPSSRGIIIRDNKIAMIYSKRFDYYKLPGGGIEPGENKIEAMIREVKEETGLTVNAESVQEFGYVHRIQKGKHEPIFLQDNYYYLCSTDGSIGDQELTEKELVAEFELQFVKPIDAINKNKEHLQKGGISTMLEREIKVLELLIDEGILK